MKLCSGALTGAFLLVLTTQGCLSRKFHGEMAKPKIFEFRGLDGFGPQPANMDRFITCPVDDHADATWTFNGKSYTSKARSAVNWKSKDWVDEIARDWNALKGLAPANTEMVVIDIRRVNGEPHYFYLSNGKQHTLYEPWSSSKFIAAAGAIARAHQDSGKGKPPVTAAATVGGYDIGDLITAIHTYQAKGKAPGGGSSGVDGSNGISRYFFEVAGADFLTSLFHDRWLRLPSDDRFRGAFGPFYFDPGSATWTDPNGNTARMGPISSGVTGDKTMSALAQAEFLKRLTQHQNDKSGLEKLDLLQDIDVEILFYGSKNRPGEMGGMLAGQSVYMAEAITGEKTGREGKFGGTENSKAKEKLDSQTGGKWRIFHKLGAGDSSSRNVSEIVMASYACLPGVDGAGREFVVITSAHADSLSQANKMTHEAFNAVVPKLLGGGLSTVKLDPVFFATAKKGNGAVYFKVNAPGADKVVLFVDGLEGPFKTFTGADLKDGVVEFEHSFANKGNRQLKAKAYKDGQLVREGTQPFQVD